MMYMPEQIEKGMARSLEICKLHFPEIKFITVGENNISGRTSERNARIIVFKRRFLFAFNCLLTVPFFYFLALYHYAIIVLICFRCLQNPFLFQNLTKLCLGVFHLSSISIFCFYLFLQQSYGLSNVLIVDSYITVWNDNPFKPFPVVEKYV